MSSTAWPGLTSRKRGGTMLTASWRVMVPASAAALINSKSSSSTFSFRSWFREKDICQATSFGYHGRGIGGETGSPPSSVTFVRSRPSRKSLRSRFFI